MSDWFDRFCLRVIFCYIECPLLAERGLPRAAPADAEEAILTASAMRGLEPKVVA